MIKGHADKGIGGMTITAALRIRAGWYMCNELANTDLTVVTVITAWYRVVNSEVMIEYAGSKCSCRVTTTAIQRRIHMVGMHQRTRAITRTIR